MRKAALVILLVGIIVVNGTSSELITAARGGESQLVSRLINEGVDVNGVDERGYSALMYAARNGYLAIVTSLVKAGADVNQQDIEDGMTALHLATNARNEKVVLSLLNVGADPNLSTHSGSTPLYFAACRGKVEIVSHLIAQGADAHIFNNLGQSALTEAAGYGFTAIVEVLLEEGVDVNALSPNGGRDYSPLMCASEGGHARIVEILLARGALVNHVSHNIGFSPPNIERVMKLRHVTEEEAINLLETNPELSDLRYTALLLASLRGHSDIVRILIREGAADPNMQQWDGLTALHYAAIRGNPGLVSFLIENKAKIDVVNEDGQTPLVLAVHRGRFETANLLMANGADINIKTKLGNNPLSAAVGNSDLVKKIIFAGADIVRDKITAENYAKYIHPILEPIERLAGAEDNTPLSPREVITAAFLRLKSDDSGNSENDGLPQITGETRNIMVSKILKFLVILRLKDASFFYLVAPFLTEADIEKLDRLGSVLSFLTAPMRRKDTHLEIDKNDLIRFIEKTFNQLITRSVDLGFETIVNRMHAAFVQVDAHFKAVSRGMRAIPEIHIGTVFQYRHGEFGIYSKFANLVATNIH